MGIDILARQGMFLDLTLLAPWGAALDKVCSTLGEPT